MSRQQDVLWKDIWLGLAITVVGTVVLSAVMFTALGASMWWLVIASDIAIGFAGFRLGRKTGQWEGISASLITAFIFILSTIILIIGWMWELVPDPLPGLPRGDSTFYFVWPLTLLVCCVVGMALGMRASAGRAVKAGQARAAGGARQVVTGS